MVMGHGVRRYAPCPYFSNYSIGTLNLLPTR